MLILFKKLTKNVLETLPSVFIFYILNEHDCFFLPNLSFCFSGQEVLEKKNFRKIAYVWVDYQWTKKIWSIIPKENLVYSNFTDLAEGFFFYPNWSLDSAASYLNLLGIFLMWI